MSIHKSVNYSREAFVHPLNIGVLLVAFLTVYFLGDAGRVSHVIFSFILGLELIYLGVAPHLPQFQKYARRRFMDPRGYKAGEKTVLKNLDPESRERFLLLKSHVNRIREHFDRLPFGSQAELDNIREKMDDLLIKYMQMLELNDRYKSHLHKTDLKKLKEKIEEEKKNIRASRSERVTRGRKRRLQVLRKRRRKRELTREKNTVCESGLETIEDTIRYIYEQLITASDTELMASGLDDLLSEVSETSLTVDELLSTFQEIGNPDVENDSERREADANDNNAGKNPSIK